MIIQDVGGSIMANDNDEFKYVNEEFEQDQDIERDDNKEEKKSKKFSAPWNKKFGEDENFKTRQFSRSARNQPAKEATTLSQVLLFVLIIALVSPFLLYAVVNSQRDNAPIEERTAEQVRLSMNSEEEENGADESAAAESASIQESLRERDRELAQAESESRRAESISSRELESVPESTPEPEPEPAPTPVPEPTPAPAPEPTPAENYYTVQPGDSWYGIATRHGVDVYTLAQMNGSSIDTPIYPGAQILVP